LPAIFGPTRIFRRLRAKQRSLKLIKFLTLIFLIISISFNDEMNY
jgi:hypothetical protein